MKEQKFKLPKISRFALKQVLFIILFGAIITLASCIIGYILFTNSMENIYNDVATDIISYLKTEFNTDEYEKNINRLITSGDNYNSVRDEIAQQPELTQLDKKLDNLRNSFDCTSIYIIALDESFKKPFIQRLQATDPVENQEIIKEVQEKGVDVGLIYAMSQSEDIGPDGSLYNMVISGHEQEIVRKLYETKQKQFDITTYDNREGKSQQSVSVLEPILNNSGQVIGFMEADLKMTSLEETIIHFISLVTLYSFLISLVAIILFIWVNRRIFIDPLLTIIRNTRSFLEKDTEISEELEEIKTNDEIQLLAESILQLEKDINDYIDNLQIITAERERVQTELDLAANIQLSMLPREFPAFPDRDEFDIYAIMDPAREVGGDFYNFYMIDEDHLAVVIGDVSGKGVPASLFMMMGSILIKAQSLPDREANKIIEEANNILSDNNEAFLFITSWMGIYEISTNKLTFVNAGHEPPVLIHENGEHELIKTQPNIVLGSFSGISYKLHEYQLQKGDKLFIYTDGVPEAQNESEEFYKKERFIRFVKNIYQKNVEDIVKEAREDIREFTGEAEQFDDITIIGFEVKNDVKNE